MRCGPQNELLRLCDVKKNALDKWTDFLEQIYSTVVYEFPPICDVGYVLAT